MHKKHTFTEDGIVKASIYYTPTQRKVARGLGLLLDFLLRRP